MDVAVDSKRGQHRLRMDGAARSVLGDGLLERARALSLGLLGFTTAVGLAIVALALNQGWPLIAGSSIPQLPPPRQDIGAARVVAAGVGNRGRDRADGGAEPAEPSGASAAQGGGAGSAAGSAPDGSSELVVSPSVPAQSGGSSKPAPQKKSPAPKVQGPQGTPSAPAASPASEQPSASTTQSSNATTPTAPTATVSEAPASGSVPSWSNGNGHAYGRSDDSSGHSHGWGDGDRDWGDHDSGWDGHGHHWGH